MVWAITTSHTTSHLSRNIAAANDGKYVVFGNGSSIQTIDRNGSVLWDWSTGAWVSSVAMSGDGRTTGAISDAIYFFNSQVPVTPPDTTGNPEMKTLLPISSTSGLPVKPATTPSTPLSPITTLIALGVCEIAVSIATLYGVRKR
jgi:hypothetical protein